jgi:hypothetical protein
MQGLKALGTSKNYELQRRSRTQLWLRSLFRANAGSKTLRPQVEGPPMSGMRNLLSPRIALSE